MKLKNLGELNRIYNFQDTIIVCEIFEQRYDHLQKLLNIIHVNVILQVYLVSTSAEIKVSV